jgi:deferrochelatase/peroxidase EfeB
MEIDIKAIVIVVCLAANGFLLYENRRRDNALMELAAKVGTAQPGESNSAAAEIELINAIRDEVKTQLLTVAASGSGNCNGKSNMGSMVRLQELQMKVNEFDKRFKSAMEKLGAGEESESKIHAKAAKIKDKVIALCKR